MKRICNLTYLKVYMSINLKNKFLMTMNYLYNQKKKTLNYFHLGKKIP